MADETTTADQAAEPDYSKLLEQMGPTIQEAVNAATVGLSSQVKGLQSAWDKQQQTAESQARQRDVDALRESLSDDPEAVARLERLAKQPDTPSADRGADSPEGEQALRETLRRIGIDPNLSTIDYKQDVNTVPGQIAFMRSAVEAHAASLKAVADDPPPKDSDAGDPPVTGVSGGSGSGAGFSSEDELLDAFVAQRIGAGEARSIAARNNWRYFS